MRIVISSFDHRLLDRVASNLLEKLLSSGYSVKGPVMLPVKRKRWTILSSPFVHKNARHQLELVRSKRFLDVREGVGQNQKNISSLLGEIELPCGVELLIKNA